MSDNKQIVSIQDQIRAQATALKESMAEKTITVNRKGNFQIGPVESDSNTMQVVLLAFTHSGAYWEKAWNPGQSAVPDCSVTGDLNTQYAENAKPPMIASFFDLIPRAIEDKPPQAANCGECPMNQFGTGTGGKGKACKNSYTLAVLPHNDATGSIHKVRISASGLKHMHDYLKTLATVGTAWFAVRTTLKAVEAGSGWSVQVIADPKSLTALSDKELAAFYGRIEEAKKMLTFTPSTPAGDTTVAAPKRDTAA